MIDTSPNMWWLVAAVTIPTAVLCGIRLWAIERRDQQRRIRLQAFRGSRDRDIPPIRSLWFQHLGSWFGPMVGVVEQERLLKLLAQAGIKGHASLTSFIAMKVLAAFIVAALAWLLIESRHVFEDYLVFRLAGVGASLIIGWRLPDIVLYRLVKQRRLHLEHGIPDALDLLVVCAESGLSLNQAIEEISKQLRFSNRDIADEFAATSAEMKITPDFGAALDNMVERTGLDDLNGFVSTLKQSIKFGTPLAESLRMIAAEMRAQRHARIEERAARLPVLLAVPMMVFILPCLLMIIGTPVVLRLIDTFKTITFGTLR